jgi:hypothetical protein
MSLPLGQAVPKRIKISAALAAQSALATPSDPSKSIHVIDYMLVAAGAQTAKLQSNNTDLTGAMSMVTGTPLQATGAATSLLATAQGETLNLNLSAAVQVSGHLTYVER